MNQNRAIGGALAVAVVVCAGVWYVLPSLEAATRKVDREAAVHIERARRLLHQYNANLDYQSLLVDTLRELGVDAETPEDLSDDGADIYQESHTKLWESFNPADGIDPPRPVQPRYGDIDNQIRQGVAARETLIADNEQLLADAAHEINAALSVSSGGADARSHAEANRLKGVIEYYEGLALRLSAGLLRNDAQAYRRDLADLAGRVEALKKPQTILDDSGVDALIVSVNEQLEQKELEVRRREREVTAFDDKIAELQGRIDAAESRRDKARRNLDQLRAQGIDFSSPDGPSEFAARITEQDRVYREAIREMESLHAGSYPYAQIDATGDYLHGRYLENGSPVNLTIEPGLKHYQFERDIAQAELDQVGAGLDGRREDIARLAQVRDQLVQQQKDAQNRIAAIVPQAAEVFDELLALEEDATDLEEEALGKLAAAARSSRNAATLVGNWMSDARDQTQSLSPAKLERSAFAKRAQSTWMSGHVAAQGADAGSARAWVFYDRYLSASRNAEVFAAIPPDLNLPEADAEAEREAATEARDAGVAAIDEVHTILQRAHRDAERQWTFVAQDAGAKYLLALFGDDSYVADSIEAYREALKGREDEPYVQRLATRLRQLEARQP